MSSFDEEEVKGLLRPSTTSSFNSDLENTDDDDRVMVRIGNGKVPKQRRNGGAVSAFSRGVRSLAPLLIGATILGFFTGLLVFQSGSSQDSLEIPTMQHAGGFSGDDEYWEKESQLPTVATKATVEATVAATTATATTTAAATTTTTMTASTTMATTEASSTKSVVDDDGDGDDDSDLDRDENTDDDDDFQEDADPIKYYMSVRTDRSGSALCGYLLLHSYAFATNNTYGGACFDTIDWDSYLKKHNPSFKGKVKARLEDTKRLTKLIGLENELPYECPSDEDLESGKAVMLQKRGQYKKPGYTVEWLKYVQSKSTFQYAPPRGPNDPLDVVMHVRRGDFTPCHVMDRYLSNSYYLKVMKKYLPPLCDNHEPGCKITLYTEEDTWESFEPFTAWPNLTFDYDSSLEDIWSHFMNADVFIMSKSSFSQVPAMMNRGTNVISPYVVGEFGMEEDIPTWIKVDPDILKEAEECSQNAKDNVCTEDDDRGRYTPYYTAHPDEKLPGKKN